MKQKFTVTTAHDETQEAALKKYLTSRGEIAIRWSVEDVHFVRPQLSHEQAFEVLLECRDRHDCDIGFTWQLIREIADELYPPDKRSQQAT